MFRIIKLLFFFLIFIPKLNAENITESQEISGVTRTAQQHIKDDADITFTITNSTISRANYTIKIKDKFEFLLNLIFNRIIYKKLFFFTDNTFISIFKFNFNISKYSTYDKYRYKYI